MGSTSTFLAVLVVVLLALNVGQFYYWTEIHEEEEEGVLDVKDINANWEDYIGEEVTVQGFYVNASGPMLISSLDLLMINLEMPEDSYLPLTGDVTINDTKYGGSLVEVDGVVQEASEGSYRYPSPARAELDFRDYEVISPAISPLYPVIIKFKLIPELFIRDKYAVLISGGVNSYNNHYRYWNDMKFMYSILINKYGFVAENIKVIYADGVPEDADMPVNYSATVANVQAVFDELQNKMYSKDMLFIFVTDHGGGFWPADPEGDYLLGGRVDTGGDEADSWSEATFGEDFNGDGDTLDTLAFDESIWLWGYMPLYDDDLASMLDELNAEVGGDPITIVVMEQCFSGGFIRDLSGTNRIIMSACGEHEPSWSCDTEGTYDEFVYHFMSAVNEETPYGVLVVADTDGIPGVSMVEAFNYAITHDSRAETPYYDDDGNGVGHDGPIPELGDGTVGNNVYL